MDAAYLSGLLNHLRSTSSHPEPQLKNELLRLFLPGSLFPATQGRRVELVASRDGGNNDLEKVQTLFECIKLVLDKESWHDAQARDFLLQIFQKMRSALALFSKTLKISQELETSDCTEECLGLLNFSYALAGKVMSLVTACLENLAAAFQSMNKAPQTFKISAALGKAFACGQVGGLISSVLQVERDCVEAAAQLGNPAIRDAEALPLKQGLRMKIAQKANRELKPQIERSFAAFLETLGATLETLLSHPADSAMETHGLAVSVEMGLEAALDACFSLGKRYFAKKDFKCMNQSWRLLSSQAKLHMGTLQPHYCSFTLNGKKNSPQPHPATSTIGCELEDKVPSIGCQLRKRMSVSGGIACRLLLYLLEQSEALIKEVLETAWRIADESHARHGAGQGEGRGLGVQRHDNRVELEKLSREVKILAFFLVNLRSIGLAFLPVFSSPSSSAGAGLRQGLGFGSVRKLAHVACWVAGCGELGSAQRVDRTLDPDEELHGPSNGDAIGNKAGEEEAKVWGHLADLVLTMAWPPLRELTLALMKALPATCAQNAGVSEDCKSAFLTAVAAAPGMEIEEGKKRHSIGHQSLLAGGACAVLEALFLHTGEVFPRATVSSLCRDLLPSLPLLLASAYPLMLHSSSSQPFLPRMLAACLALFHRCVKLHPWSLATASPCNMFQQFMWAHVGCAHPLARLFISSLFALLSELLDDKWQHSTLHAALVLLHRAFYSTPGNPPASKSPRSPSRTSCPPLALHCIQILAHSSPYFSESVQQSLVQYLAMGPSRLPTSAPPTSSNPPSSPPLQPAEMVVLLQSLPLRTFTPVLSQWLTEQLASLYIPAMLQGESSHPSPAALAASLACLRCLFEEHILLPAALSLRVPTVLRSASRLALLAAALCCPPSTESLPDYPLPAFAQREKLAPHAQCLVEALDAAHASLSHAPRTPFSVARQLLLPSCLALLPLLSPGARQPWLLSAPQAVVLLRALERAYTTSRNLHIPILAFLGHTAKLNLQRQPRQVFLQPSSNGQADPAELVFQCLIRLFHCGLRLSQDEAGGAWAEKAAALRSFYTFSQFATGSFAERLESLIPPSSKSHLQSPPDELSSFDRDRESTLDNPSYVAVVSFINTLAHATRAPVRQETISLALEGKRLEQTPARPPTPRSIGAGEVYLSSQHSQSVGQVDAALHTLLLQLQAHGGGIVAQVKKLMERWTQVREEIMSESNK